MKLLLQNSSWDVGYLPCFPLRPNLAILECHNGYENTAFLVNKGLSPLRAMTRFSTHI